MNTSKDRETYSFSISYNNVADSVMNKYITDKIANGTKLSTYIRSLIEQDMIAHGVIVDKTSKSGFRLENSNENIEQKVEEIHSILSKLNQFQKQSLKEQYEKMLQLEFLVKNNSNSYNFATTHNPAYLNTDINEDNVSKIIDTIKAQDNTNLILDSINKLYNYNNESINTTKSLLDVINAQNKMIEQLSNK